METMVWVSQYPITSDYPHIISSSSPDIPLTDFLINPWLNVFQSRNLYKCKIFWLYQDAEQGQGVWSFVIRASWMTHLFPLFRLVCQFLCWTLIGSLISFLASTHSPASHSWFIKSWKELRDCLHSASWKLMPRLNMNFNELQIDNFVSRRKIYLG